jgi:uncharacterized protein (DUF2342 family)
VNFAFESIIGKTLVSEAAANTIGFVPPAAAAADELVTAELELDEEEATDLVVVLLELLLPQPTAKADSPTAAATAAARLPQVTLTTDLFLLHVFDRIRAPY